MENWEYSKSCLDIKGRIISSIESSIGEGDVGMSAFLLISTSSGIKASKSDGFVTSFILFKKVAASEDSWLDWSAGFMLNLNSIEGEANL